jgi:hypothetical protein
MKQHANPLTLFAWLYFRCIPLDAIYCSLLKFNWEAKIRDMSTLSLFMSIILQGVTEIGQ